MNCCKLLIIATILFFGGICGQLRFQRHLDTTATTTQNGLDQGLAEVNSSNLDGELELASDNDYVVLKESHETVEVKLSSDGQLKFRVCSDGCTDKDVTVCYDAVSGSINKEAKVGCGQNQCGIKAGVKEEYGQNVFHFMAFKRTLTRETDKFCGEATMTYPKATVSGFEVESCEPVKHDGNAVKLYVKYVDSECSIKVIGAKIWYPTTTASPTTTLPLSTPLSSSNETGSSSSSANADTTWWIVGGILAGIFVLVILGCIGFCVYRNHKQKKDAAAAKAKAEHELKYASLESLPTVDLATTATAVQKEEQEEKPKKEAIKKDKSETKQKHKKAAPAPTKVMASKEAPPTVPAKVLPTKEATTEELKIKPSQEKAVVEVQKEKKGAAKETPKNDKKVVEKGIAAVPPPPPRRKAATPKQQTVDKTQEESPSIEKQEAFEDVSSSPTIEKKPPKKAPSKKAAKKSSKKKYAPPSTPPSRGGRHSSKKLSTRRREMQKYGLNSEEWKDFQAQMNRPPGKVVEWNPSASSSNY